MSTTAKPTSKTAPLSEPQLLAWRGMLRAHAALTKALDADLEAQHGLPLTSYEVLLQLDHASGQRLRMSDLAARVILSRSGLTRLVDRLERERLIVRETCPSDARGAFAKLTPEGSARLAAARPTHLAGIRSIFIDRLGPDELDALGRVWERLLPDSAHDAGPACG